MTVQSFLDEMGINYRTSRHPIAYTAQDLASAEHVPGRQVIKPVIVKADGRFVMCALPPRTGSISMGAARAVGSRRRSPGQRAQAGGAVPRVRSGGGGADRQVVQHGDDHGRIADRESRVTFQAGTHYDAVTMSLAEYRRAAQPGDGVFQPACLIVLPTLVHCRT